MADSRGRQLRAPHSIAQHWARTIRAARPELNGLAYRGRFAGALCVALFRPAADAFPRLAEMAVALDHPELPHGWPAPPTVSAMPSK